MARLWWLGLYESVQPPVLPWLFTHDYSYDIAIRVLKISLKGIAGGECSTNISTYCSDIFQLSLALSFPWAGESLS